MDGLLSQVDIKPNANLDELTKNIASVLAFLQIEPYLEPNANEIRMFLRAVLFLYGNLEVHGEILEQQLKQCQQIPKNELNSVLAKFHDGTLIDDVCRKLLITKTGPNHILEIQGFCNDFLDPMRYVAILNKVKDSRSDLITDEVAVEAKFLISRIFQLNSTSDIDTGIKRLLQTVNFDILAWIINFNEPHTYLFMKCLIIQKEICSGLENGSISENFTASMSEQSCQDDKVLSAYIKCLQNKYFSKSLMIFFINYLTAIGDGNLETDKSDIRKHDLLHVSFLIAGMLSSKSECRIEFHKKLAAMSVGVNVLLSISHLNFIYNF